MNGTPDEETPSFMSYVGSLNRASGIYLGEYNGAYWVLTAEHVGYSNTFEIGGEIYSGISGSGRQVGLYDLYLFQIEVAPGSTLAGLSPLSIATTAFSGSNQSLYMVGNGGSGQVAKYDPVTTELLGYSYDKGGRELNWGLGYGEADDYDYRGVMTRMIRSDFSNDQGNAAGVLGDSGGGYFRYIDDKWVLVGLIVANEQQMRDKAALFGDYTLAIDLGTYSSTIYGMIPEPGTVGLLFTVAVAGGVWTWNGHRRNRRRVS